MELELREYLSTRPGGTALALLGDHDSLLAAGVIDSVAMVDLIAQLERRYGIRIDEEDMLPENFDSIAAIAAYVSRKRAA